MAKHGIDISKHNGAVNWALVKASGKADFAILRAGYGKLVTQKDPRFDENYKGVKAVGIPVGAYWYSYAMDADGAREEARACIECIKGKQLEYPVYFDVEEAKQLALGKDKVTSIIGAFCEEMEKAGYFVGLYMSASPLSTLVRADVAKRYAVWVAHYGVPKPSYAGPYGMWQRSSSGSISGIAGAVDLDECYTDYPAAIKAKGLNGYPATPAEPAKQTKEVTLTIDGETWKGTLTKA